MKRKTQCRMRISKCGMGSDAPRLALPAPIHSAFRNPQSAIPLGMTLVELLVTIVILVTVLAAVVPMLSPNNDARKIREAARQLNSMLVQAQAQAARDGRAYGVAFRESLIGGDPSGMALEAFFIAQPPSYAGFSTSSRVRFGLVMGKVRYVQFMMGGPMVGAAGKDAYPLDPIPPQSIRYGDILRCNGMDFIIVDQDRDGDGTPDIVGTGPDPIELGDYYYNVSGDPENSSVFDCVYVGDQTPPTDPTPPKWPRGLEAISVSPIVMEAVQPLDLSGIGTLPVTGWTTPSPYQIIRQPANTADAPLQFPSGIGIDLQGSAVDGPPWLRLPDPPPNPPNDLVPTDRSFDVRGNQDIVGIMFAPNGSLDGLYFNGAKARGVESIYLLLGRIESANGSQRANFSDLNGVTDQGQIAERRREVNWTDPDALWLTINSRSGRIVTSANNMIDVTNTTPGGPDNLPFNEDPVQQLEAARQFAREATGMGGR